MASHTKSFLERLATDYQSRGQLATADVLFRAARQRTPKPVTEVAPADELVIVPEPPDEIWEFQIAAAEPVEVESEEL